ncbi:aspartate/glutamate racemase family protein [Denitrobaculum tricleocarpae]|uniref:Aspartate/glutamate racemase family protein n=1 Tax=Denitrobaculum tricleocarpae TaxID=2591009 RepID=A0A545U349_9PROT|nr:aspartate/glutamate racemase family protein [Denitrobaculum tricleocarpae]TQV83844.1 aspartate/glutamate racemase family protein [Denitrobaculum tricleocarpae]
MKVKGGKSLYGASVGILMLETRFPRIQGDMCNALTWPFPVHYKVVSGASPDRVVRNRAEGLLDTFLTDAKALVAQGADGITTNCGFLSLFQDQLAEACGVPVATSSLMQVEAVNRLLPPGKRCGILTISRKSLSEEHLQAARVPLDTPVGGTDGLREFSRVILDDEEELDIEASRLDLIDAARDLKEANPDVGAIVLECTNMVPFAADVRAATGLPVYSIYSYILWFQSALAPRVFPQGL